MLLCSFYYFPSLTLIKRLTTNCECSFSKLSRFISFSRPPQAFSCVSAINSYSPSFGMLVEDYNYKYGNMTSKSLKALNDKEASDAEDLRIVERKKMFLNLKGTFIRKVPSQQVTISFLQNAGWIFLKLPLYFSDDCSNKTSKSQ